MITKLKQSGRVRWTQGIGWLPAQVGQRRWGLQSVFQVEGEKIINNIGVLYRTPRPSYWLTWEPLSESLWCWQKTKDIGVIKRTWDCTSLWPMLFPGYSYSYSWCFQGTGEFINTRFFCRVCALMHNTQVCTHQYDLGQLVLILIISVSWFSSSLSRSVGSPHHYLGHHLNDFKSYFSYFGHTPHLRVFGPCL